MWMNGMEWTALSMAWALLFSLVYLEAVVLSVACDRKGILALGISADSGLGRIERHRLVQSFQT